MGRIRPLKFYKPTSIFVCITRAGSSGSSFSRDTYSSIYLAVKVGSDAFVPHPSTPGRAYYFFSRSSSVFSPMPSNAEMRSPDTASRRFYSTSLKKIIFIAGLATEIVEKIRQGGNSAKGCQGVWGELERSNTVPLMPAPQSTAGLPG